MDHGPARPFTFPRFDHDELLHLAQRGICVARREGKTLEEVDGRVKCADFRRSNPPQGFPPGYPRYTEIVVKATNELIEHRKMEPVFYVTDDPAVWKEYRAAGCGS